MAHGAQSSVETLSHVIAYTDQELEAMLGDLESELVERKSTLDGDAPDKMRQAVCAFANDLPGRQKAVVLCIGVHDNGRASGLLITDRLLVTLADLKTEGQMLPPPTLTVEKRVLRGAPVAVVIVQPADAPPVRYRGRTWIRIGPRRGLATAQDERILNERRRHLDLPFDMRPVRSATVADLSRARFEEEYWPAAVAPDVLAANDRTYEERLAAARMIASIDDRVPTVAGILTLGARPRDFLPGAYVQFLRIAGAGLADPIQDEAKIDGPLADVVRRTEEKLQAHDRIAVDLVSGPLEKRTASSPLAALQQLVRNAVLHRTYEGTHAPIRVVWFDDRIEIANPGGPFGQVTEKNFGRPGVVDYRNPSLAEVLRVLGFVQRFGVGIETARDQLKRSGHPPLEFELQPELVRCTVRARSSAESGNA